MGRPYILRKGVSRLGDLADGLSASLPWFVNNVFWCDYVNGNDGNDGDSREQAFQTAAKGLSLCTADQDDCVVLLNKETLAANLDWNKKKVHLFGASAIGGLVGGGGFQSSVAAVTDLFTLSANECIIKDLFFDNYGTDAACVGAFKVTGIMNQIVNCAMYLGNNGSAGLDVATAYDCMVTGAYNRFTNCMIGSGYSLTGATRGALRIDGQPGDLIFEGCIIRMHSSETGAGCVKFDTTEDVCFPIFRDCIFQGECYGTPAGGAAIENTMIVGSVSGTPQGDALVKDCIAIGVTDLADANLKAYVFTNQPAGSGAGSIAVVSTGT